MRGLLFFLLVTATAFGQDGAAIYKARCAGCHDAPVGRVPPASALRTMSAATILQALESGPMKAQAAGLTNTDLHSLVAYLAAPPLNPAAPVPAKAFCAGSPHSPSDSLEAARWKGWGANSANARFEDSATAGMTAADIPKLKLKWAFGLGDGTLVRSQAAVGGNHVFVAGLTGQLYSLDAGTGCIEWTFEAASPVRTSIVFGAAGGSGLAVYFADQRANAYGVDASTGKLLWRVNLADHPAAMITGAPQLHDGVLYVPVSSYEEILAGSPAYECCTFRGSVVALDGATGKIIWKTYTIAESSQPTKKSSTGTQLRGPSGAAAWSTPTLDEQRNVLYVSTGDNYSDPPSTTSDAVLALDAKSGKLLWSKQVTPGDVYSLGVHGKGRDFDFGQPPVLVSLTNGHRALVIGQKSGELHALDPDRQGEIMWQARLGEGGALGGIQWGSASDGENIYVALSDLVVNSVPDKSAPLGSRFELNPDKGGGLFALRLASGERVWSAKPVPCGERKQCSPAQSAAVTAIPGVVFSGSVDGHLRAYSAATGQIIWDADTAQKYETVNGKEAKGGSLDVAGPVIYRGILYVNSGYGQWGGMPGNVLLAFSIDGK